MTGIVLAGGRSRRFGSDKALAAWNGKTMIETVIDVLSPVCRRVLVVTKSPERFSFLTQDGVEIVRDVFFGHHAMGGLYAGLSASGDAAHVVCACDMPLLKTSLIDALPRFLDGNDAVVPVWNGEIQPLCAAYATSCLPTLARLIARGDHGLKDALGHLRTRFLFGPELEALDPSGRSFIDIDTKEEYEVLQP